MINCRSSKATAKLLSWSANQKSANPTCWKGAVKIRNWKKRNTKTKHVLSRYEGSRISTSCRTISTRFSVCKTVLDGVWSHLQLQPRITMDTTLHTQHVPQQFLIPSGLFVIYLSRLRITFYLDAHRRSREHCCMCETDHDITKM